MVSFIRQIQRECKFFIGSLQNKPKWLRSCIWILLSKIIDHFTMKQEERLDTLCNDGHNTGSAHHVTFQVDFSIYWSKYNLCYVKALTNYKNTHNFVWCGWGWYIYLLKERQQFFCHTKTCTEMHILTYYLSPEVKA